MMRAAGVQSVEFAGGAVQRPGKTGGQLSSRASSTARNVRAAGLPARALPGADLQLSCRAHSD